MYVRCWSMGLCTKVKNTVMEVEEVDDQILYNTSKHCYFQWSKGTKISSRKLNICLFRLPILVQTPCPHPTGRRQMSPNWIPLQYFYYLSRFSISISYWIYPGYIIHYLNTFSIYSTHKYRNDTPRPTLKVGYYSCIIYLHAGYSAKRVRSGHCKSGW